MKAKIYVKEIIYHKVEIDLPEDEMKDLIQDLDGLAGGEIAGDLCSNNTAQDGEWELDYYDLGLS